MERRGLRPGKTPKEIFHPHVVWFRRNLLRALLHFCHVLKSYHNCEDQTVVLFSLHLHLHTSSLHTQSLTAWGWIHDYRTPMINQTQTIHSLFHVVMYSNTSVLCRWGCFQQITWKRNIQITADHTYTTTLLTLWCVTWSMTQSTPLEVQKSSCD